MNTFIKRDLRIIRKIIELGKEGLNAHWILKIPYRSQDLKSMNFKFIGYIHESSWTWIVRILLNYFRCFYIFDALNRWPTDVQLQHLQQDLVVSDFWWGFLGWTTWWFHWCPWLWKVCCWCHHKYWNLEIKCSDAKTELLVTS